MHGTVSALGSNRYELIEDGSDGTSREIQETTGQDGLRLEWVTPSRGRRPKPAWWLLYAFLPLTALLFMLADAVPATSRWRSISELAATFGVLCAIALWVRANRIALILAEHFAPSESSREIP